ncbi:MAG: ferredoxin, partial [Megasphaera sp.]|nr:ferredoxin [Megasphaera sp.]
MNKITKIKAVYFSPTGTTKKTVTTIAATLAEKLNISWKMDDFTLPPRRKTPLVFKKNELIVFGVPVYAGRVPNIIIKYIA